MNNYYSHRVLSLIILTAVVLVVPLQSQASHSNFKTLLKKRNNCVENRLEKQSYTLNTAPSSTYHRAELKCTKTQGVKHGNSESKEIIKLCVHTHLVSGYAPGKGLAGALTPELLKAFNSLGMYLGVTINENGNVTITDDQMESWSNTCKTLVS